MMRVLSLIAIDRDFQLTQECVKDIFSTPSPRPFNHLRIVKVKEGMVFPSVVVHPQRNWFFAQIAPTSVAKDPVALLDASVRNRVNRNVPSLSSVW